MKYILALVAAITLGITSVGYASNCNVSNFVVYGNRQFVTEYYAAPVRERVVVEYAEVPLVKETVRDYYGNEVQRVVDRGRNKELVRVERQLIGNHHHNQQVQKVVKIEQVKDRQNLRDRLKNRNRQRRNQKVVKEIRIERVEVQNQRGHH